MTADASTRRQPWLANWLGICGQQGVCSGCGRADHHRQQPTLDRGAVEAQVCPLQSLASIRGLILAKSRRVRLDGL